MTYSGMRANRLVLTFGLGVALAGLPHIARAQTATPTAPACVGVSKASLSWMTQSPSTVKLAVSVTNCNLPARCGLTAAGSTVTKPPIVFGVSDNNGATVAGVVTDVGTNVHGCPGGIDGYKGSMERMRFIFGARTTFVGQIRVPVATPAPSGTPIPPALVPPLTFSLYDANGYAIGGVMSTCTTKQSGRWTYLRCH